MSYYRDVYLKSDEWKSIRREAIFKDSYRCRLCLERPKRNGSSVMKKLQVHHVKYKNLHDVTSSDLRTLCVPCHEAVHTLMDKYPKMKTLPRNVLWQTVVYHLRPERRQSLAGQVKGIDRNGLPCKQTKKEKPLGISQTQRATEIIAADFPVSTQVPGGGISVWRTE